MTLLRGRWGVDEPEPPALPVSPADQLQRGPTPVPRPRRVLTTQRRASADRNPLNGMLNDLIEARGVQVEPYRFTRLICWRPDVLHIHWPESRVTARSRLRAAFGLTRWAGRLAAARVRHVPVVWTVHNLSAHEPRHPVLERTLLALVARSVTGIVSMSHDAEAAALRRWPVLHERALWRVPLPHFRPSYVDVSSRTEARRWLGIERDRFVVLFFGQVREYKNVPLLVDAFAETGLPATTLVVAGDPATHSLRARIEAAAGRAGDVRLELRSIPDDEVHRFFRAADVVVLPFARILNSATALLALSFDRPVVVPNMGAMADLAHDVGERWVRLYDGPFSPAVLRSACAWAAEPRAGRPPLDDRDPASVAAALIEAYSAAMRSSPRRPARSESAGRAGQR